MAKNQTRFLSPPPLLHSNLTDNWYDYQNTIDSPGERYLITQILRILR